MDEIRVLEGGELEPNGPYKFLGVPLTPDFLMKLIMLVFALGILYNKMEGLEEKLSDRIDNKSEIIKTQLESFDYRLQAVERKIDQAEVRDYRRDQRTP